MKRVGRTPRVRLRRFKREQRTQEEQEKILTSVMVLDIVTNAEVAQDVAEKEREQRARRRLLPTSGIDKQNAANAAAANNSISSSYKNRSGITSRPRRVSRPLSAPERYDGPGWGVRSRNRNDQGGSQSGL
jgi:hypothetical protein